jgi:hypothetical protein
MVTNIYTKWFCPPNRILLILDEMLREDLDENTNAKVFLLWALFRAYFYGESDYMYWKDAFLNDRTTVTNAACNPYLLRIHGELNNIIKFYKNDQLERRRIEQIKKHINLYFRFKPVKNKLCR